MFKIKDLLMDEATGGEGEGASGGEGGGQSGTWYQALEPDVQGWLDSKGLRGDDPAKVAPELAQSYRNLEKLLGADKAGRTVVRPKPLGDNPSENEVAAHKAEVDAFYQALGRPKEAKDYGLELPEGTEWLGDAFFEHGLTADQARGLTDKLKTQHTELSEKTQREYEEQVERETSELKGKWGEAYDQNLNIARQAAKDLDMTGEQIDALEQVMGYRGVHEFLHGLGTKIGEAQFHDGAGPALGGRLTPEQAQGRIATLKKDKAFIDRFMAGDAESRAEWNRLHKAAYPGESPAG